MVSRGGIPSLTWCLASELTQRFWSGNDIPARSDAHSLQCNQVPVDLCHVLRSLLNRILDDALRTVMWWWFPYQAST